jgi:branched-chain amino acid transport system substrate-binding protein
MPKEALTMDRRSFLTIATTGAATFAFPAIVRSQGKDPIRIGFPLPLTGPFAAIAGDMKQGAELAVDELNAKGGILGRKVELLVRDDQLKPQVGAQRTQELIEKEKCQFIVGGLAAHVQMAINEQTKKAKVLFISTSQSDEISAKPDTSPITFHEALNPTITSRVVGKWVMENLGKKWYMIYADYAWGKQNNAVLTEVNKKYGGTVLGSIPYPLGSAEFSAHLPKIQAAKPDVLVSCTPGADNIAFLKQVKSFGMHNQMKIAQPLHWISVAKQGGPELYQDIYAGINFYWELQDQIPEAKKYVDGFQKKFGIPPGDYSVYAYSAVLEVARGSEMAKSTDGDAVANALRKSPKYNHAKGGQFWRACDNKSFQDMWIVKGRAPGKTKGEWGLYDIVSRVPASEEYDRTCAEKGHA